MFVRAQLLHLCGRARLDPLTGTRPLLAMLLPWAQEPFEHLSRAQRLDVRCTACGAAGVCAVCHCSQGGGGGGGLRPRTSPLLLPIAANHDGPIHRHL